MPKIKLSKTAVDRIKAPDPSGRQVLHWDLDLKGFGLLVSGTTHGKSYVAQRTLPDGRTRRVTIGSTAEIDVDAARAKAADVIHAMRNGQDPKAKQAAVWTLRRTLDEYLKANPVKPHTARDYRYSVERYLTDWIDMPLASITMPMVEDKHRTIQAGIAKRRTNPAHWNSEAGASQANAVMVVLRALWGFAELRDDKLPRNPTRILRRQWFAGPRRERLVTNDDLPIFYQAVDALPNPTSRDYIKLLLWSGLRRGEASMLRWDMIDFTGRLIRLPAQITKAKRKLDLPMSTFVRDLLITRRALGNDGGWVFGGGSKSGHIEEPQSAFAQIAAACQIRVSSHDMRRTFITVAESCDISPMALKGLVNHSLGGDVTGGYVQMTPERLREPAQRVCDRLMTLCGIAETDDQKVARLG